MSVVLDAVMYNRLRPEIRVMAQVMERKFRENSHRGDPFRGCEWDFLLMRQREEQKEFCDAIKQDKGEAAVFEEAADLMNFILMQANQYSDEWRRRNGIKIDREMNSSQLADGTRVYVPHVDDNAGTGGSGKKKVRK
jgi:NTP pyrophosphatase (non-canonical NTP hydrolase)